MIQALMGFAAGALLAYLLMLMLGGKKLKAAQDREKSLAAAAKKFSAESSALGQRVRQMEAERQANTDLVLLFPDIIKMIFSGRDSDEVVGYINRAMKNLLKADEVAVFLADRTGARLGLAASEGFSGLEGRRLNLALGEGFVGFSAETGKLLSREDLEKESVLVRRNLIMSDIAGFKPEFAAPMQAEGVLYGVITAGGFEGELPMRRETLRALAAVGAAALENARMLERFGRSSDLDPETGFSGKTSLEPLVENELERVERFGSPLAIMELHLESADADDSIASREIVAAAARHLRASLRNIDIGIRTGRGSIVLLLPGTNGEGLKAVTGKLGGEMPLLERDNGGRVGTVKIRGCVVEGGSRASSLELLEKLKTSDPMDFEGYYEA
jgi:hypothetical protein